MEEEDVCRWKKSRVLPCRFGASNWCDSLTSVTVRIIPIKLDFGAFCVINPFQNSNRCETRIISVSLQYRRLLFAQKYKTFSTGLLENI